MASLQQSSFADASSTRPSVEGWQREADAYSMLSSVGPVEMCSPARRLRRRLQDPLDTPVPPASQEYMQDLTPTEASSDSAQPASQAGMAAFGSPWDETTQDIPRRARTPATQRRQIGMSSILLDVPMFSSHGSEPRLAEVPLMSRDMPSSHGHHMTAHASAAADYRPPDMELDDLAERAPLPGGQSIDSPWFDAVPVSNDGPSGPGQQRTSYDLDDLFMDHAQRPRRTGFLSTEATTLDDRHTGHAAERLPTAQPCVRLRHVPPANPMLDALSMSSPGISQTSEQRHLGHHDNHGHQQMLTSRAAPRSHPITFGDSGHLRVDTALQSAASLAATHEDLPQAPVALDDPAAHLRHVRLGSAGRSAGQQHARSGQERHHIENAMHPPQQEPFHVSFQPSSWPSPFNGMPDPHSEIRRLPEYPQPFAMPFHAADARASVAAENEAMSHHDSRREPMAQYRLSNHALELTTSELQAAATGSLTADDQASRSRPWPRNTPTPLGFRHRAHQEPQGDEDPALSLGNASGLTRPARLWHPALLDQALDSELLPPEGQSERNDAAHALLGSDVPSEPPYTSSQDEVIQLDGVNHLDDVDRLDDIPRRAPSRGGASSWMRPRALDDAHFSMLARDAMEVRDRHAGLQDTLSAMRARLGLPFGDLMARRERDVFARLKSQRSMQEALQAAKAHQASHAPGDDAPAGPQELAGVPGTGLARSAYFVDDICTVCWKEQTEIAYLPCRHLAICSGCQTILGACKPCILCRKAVDEYKYVPASPNQATTVQPE